MLITTAQQNDSVIHIYTLFFIFFTIMVYHRILNMCFYSRTLLFIHSIYSSLQTKFLKRLFVLPRHCFLPWRGGFTWGKILTSAQLLSSRGTFLPLFFHLCLCDRCDWRPSPSQASSWAPQSFICPFLKARVPSSSVLALQPLESLSAHTASAMTCYG